MDELYRTIKWRDQSPYYRGLRKKTLFAGPTGHMDLSMPTFNGYVAACGVPWPPPLADHLVSLIDGVTAQIRWVSDALVAALGRDRDSLVLQSVGVLHPEQCPQGIWAQWRALRDREQSVIEHDAVLLCGDGLWLPVHQQVTYGQDSRYSARNEVWFVDAIATGNPFAPTQAEYLYEPKEHHDDNIINVDSRFVVELRRSSKDEVLDRVRAWQQFADVSTIQPKQYTDLLARMKRTLEEKPTDG